MRKLLTEDRQVLEVLARRLLEKEVVDEGELREIMGLPPRTHEPSEDRVVVTPPRHAAGRRRAGRGVAAALATVVRHWMPMRPATRGAVAAPPAKPPPNQARLT